MALEPGGVSNKLGNRYEGRWVAKQLLLLLSEQTRSVTLEGVGDDEIGVDLWVERADGTRQGQQCKRSNASKDSWSIADLAQRGVLHKMGFQLRRSGSYEFAFVTGIPSNVLADLCESARLPSGNVEDYYEHQIVGIGHERRSTYTEFCEKLDLDPAQQDDRRAAFDYLRRLRIELWPDTQTSIDDLRNLSNRWVIGEPDVVVPLLADFALERIHTPIVLSDLLGHLSKCNLHTRRLSNDPRVGPAVDTLQQAFSEALSEHLIQGELLPREETNEVLDVLSDSDIVVLHGDAGTGKSSVLLELAENLKRQGVPYIPVRLDITSPTGTTRQFGEALGLPESPVSCLQAIAGDGPAVLLVDQLDELRWTSSHAREALEVCKALVREARLAREAGQPLTVILACRTYELENDFPISGWLSDQSALGSRKVLVQPLPEATVRDIVTQRSRDYATMPPRQQRLLRSPHILGMWVRLAERDEDEPFETRTDLLRLYWTSARMRIAQLGVSDEDLNRVLGVLSQQMEQSQRSWVPLGLVERYSRVVGILRSEGVLRTDAAAKMVSFSHQEFLDYLIARGLATDLQTGGGTLLDWLSGTTVQSLFRREQLRKMLLLLEGENPDDFVSAVRDLLGSSSVRFHLKHLALEVVGQIREPSTALLEYVTSLVQDLDWADHALETVFNGHPIFVCHLAREGILDGWLNGEEPGRRVALSLLESIYGDEGDFVFGILQPFVGRSHEWDQRILGCLSWNALQDTEQLFGMRLNLARTGVSSDIANWARLASERPDRAIDMVEAMASRWDVAHLASSTSANALLRLEQWDRESLSALTHAAEREAARAWEVLLPHFLRLSDSGGGDIALSKLWGRGLNEFPHVSACFGLLRMLVAAGETLAGQTPAELISDTSDLAGRTGMQMLAEIYLSLSDDDSDSVLVWLLKDTARFRLGGADEPEWMPAVRLIERFSPFCSDILLTELECAVHGFHHEDERERARRILPLRREGVFVHFWGEAQFFLLRAIAQDRRSQRSAELVRVLCRKFAGHEDTDFARGGPVLMGAIGSPLRPEHLQFISDNAWLKIMADDRIPLDRGFNWTQLANGRLAESSVTQFSRDLSRIAMRFPERFGQLALRLPTDTHALYVSAILDGLRLVEPKDVPEEELAAWAPASSSTIEAALSRFESGDDREMVLSLSRLVEARPNARWSAAVVDRLVAIATEHPEPAPGELVVGCDHTAAEASVELLWQNTLNCARSAAVQAIATLLSRRQDLLPRLLDHVEGFVRDPHPVVRMAAIEVCLAILPVDKSKAVDLFLTACHDDARVPASPRAIPIFNYCTRSHLEELAPVVQSMIASDSSDVSTAGARETLARNLLHSVYDDELQMCVRGTAAHRQGIAEVAVQFLERAEYAETCMSILQDLFDDPEETVRHQVNRAFAGSRLLELPDAIPFAKAFVNSASFSVDPATLIRTMQRHPGSLLTYSGVILEVCKAFADGSLRDATGASAGGLFYAARLIPMLLLKLYDEADEAGAIESKTGCLDILDALFEARAGFTRSLIKALDQ